MHVFGTLLVDTLLVDTLLFDTLLFDTLLVYTLPVDTLLDDTLLVDTLLVPPPLCSRERCWALRARPGFSVARPLPVWLDGQDQQGHAQETATHAQVPRLTAVLLFGRGGEIHEDHLVK